MAMASDGDDDGGVWIPHPGIDGCSGAASAGVNREHHCSELGSTTIFSTSRAMLLPCGNDTDPAPARRLGRAKMGCSDAVTAAGIPGGLALITTVAPLREAHAHTTLCACGVSAGTPPQDSTNHFAGMQNSTQSRSRCDVNVRTGQSTVACL